MTKMLINAQRAGHLRVAIVEGTQLEDYQVEITEAGLTRGNIYRGVVANLQPSLNAAFVDIGEDRHAFLPVGDVLAAAYHKKPPKDERRPSIDQVLEKGKPIYVQVTKDGLGQKGAALTTNIALAGRYLVLAPFDSVRGISRKAEEDAARKKARERLQKLNAPDGYGVIVRTNGLDQNQTTLNRDLNALLRLWNKIRSEGGRGKGPRLLYSDQDLVVQALRDYLDNNIEQVIVDSDDVYGKAEDYMQAFLPRSKKKLVRYTERQPLFSRYNIEAQIDGIYDRRAQLPGGGSIVIDSTEALTAIDVNSGRATQTANHDEAIYKVNEEAAAEVARQLRLRDIGGLVVVDFIDMRPRKHQRKLEKAMRDALKADRARTAVGRISSNGLLEINRQRIKQSLRHRTHRPCPTCQGVGAIPNPKFAALNLLGRIEARASTGLMESVVVVLHPEIADALQNGHRRELAGLEEEFDITIEVMSSASLTRTQDRIDWTRREGAETPARKAALAKAPAAVSATDISSKEGAKRQSAAGDDNGEGAADRPRRKRRRRRRSPSGDGEAVEAKSAREDAPEKAESKPDKADEAASKPRRRRSSRRRRKSSDEDTPTQEMVMDRETRAKLDARKSDSKKGDAKPADKEAGDEPKPRPRRRRRSPQKRTTGEDRAAKGDAETARGREGRSRDAGSRDSHSRDQRSRDTGGRDQRSRDTGGRDQRSRDTGGRDQRSRDAGGRDTHSRDSRARDLGGRQDPPSPPRQGAGDGTPARSEAAFTSRRGGDTPPGPPARPLSASGSSEKLSSTRPLSRWLWWRRPEEGDD